MASLSGTVAVAKPVMVEFCTLIAVMEYVPAK
jgi:hypothetical protein